MTNKSVGLLTFNFGANMKGFDRAMTKAQKKLKRFGKNIKRTGKSLSMGLTLPIAALGVVSIKTFADFEQGMLKVKAVSGATVDEFKLLTESAKKLGSETMFSASQVSTLQLELSKLGLDPAEILASTESILQLAQATDTELGEASRITAIALNAFGLEATETARAVDVLAFAHSNAAIDVMNIGEALPNAAATANAFGDDIEQLTSKLMALADKTGMSGGKLGTHMKIIYQQLAKHGLTFEEAMSKIRDSQFDLNVATELFGKNAAGSAIALSKSGVAVSEYESQLRGATGTASEMADIMDSGVAGAMRKLKSQLEGVAIELGQSLIPIFKKVVGWISSMVKWFSSLTDEQRGSVIFWGLILAAIGPVLIIIGKVSLGISALIGGFKNLAKFFAAHGKKILNASPWVLLATVIIAAAAAIYEFFTNTSRVEDATKSAMKSVSKDTAKIRLLTDAYTAAGTSLEDKKKALDDLKEAYPGFYDEIDIATSSTNDLTDATNRLMGSLMAQAKVNAFTKLLEDIHGEMADLEMEYGTAMQDILGPGFSDETKFLITDDMDDLTRALAEKANKYVAETFTFTEMMALRMYRELKMEADDVVSRIMQAQKLADKFGIKPKKKKIKPDPTTIITPDTTTIVTPEPTLDELHDTEQHIISLDEALKAQEHSIDKVIEKYQQFLNKFSMVFSGLGNMLGALSDKENAVFDNWKKDQEDKMSILDEEQEAERKRIENSLMSEEGKNAALIAMEKDFADKKKAIQDDIDDKAAAIAKKQAKRDKAMNIMSSIMGTASAVIGALGAKPWSPANFALAAIVGALGAIQTGIIMSTPIPMAKGGLVTGPTTALIGEGLGTTASNPEVVAPLDSLKRMIGGEGIEVFGRISGTDIILSSKQTNINRLRSI